VGDSGGGMSAYCTPAIGVH